MGRVIYNRLLLWIIHRGYANLTEEASVAGKCCVVVKLDASNVFNSINRGELKASKLNWVSLII